MVNCFNFRTIHFSTSQREPSGVASPSMKVICADVLGLLQRTSREFNQTLVMITHNDAIAQLADRIVRIEDGKIVG